jgi:hypothetical protein
MGELRSQRRGRTAKAGFFCMERRRRGFLSLRDPGTRCPDHPRFLVGVQSLGRRWLAVLFLMTLAVAPLSVRADDETPAARDESTEKAKPATPAADPFSLEAELEKDRGEKKPATQPGGKPGETGDGEATDGDAMSADEIMDADEDTGDATFGDPTGTIFDQLDRTVRRMRTAARDLTPEQAAKSRERNQNRALRDLDELIRQIEEAANKPPSGGGGGEDQPPPEGGDMSDESPSGGKSSGGGQSGQDPSGKASSGGGKPSGGGKQSTGGSDSSEGQQSGKKKLKLRMRQQPGGTGIAQGGGRGRSSPQPKPQGPMGGQENKEPGDSQAGTREGQAEKPEDPLKERVVKDVWGHLPPHLRDQLLNVYGEKYLPKYEELVRKYYEVLAEQSRTRATPRSRGTGSSGTKPSR